MKNQNAVGLLVACIVRIPINNRPTTTVRYPKPKTCFKQDYKRKINFPQSWNAIFQLSKGFLPVEFLIE